MVNHRELEPHHSLAIVVGFFFVPEDFSPAAAVAFRHRHHLKKVIFLHPPNVARDPRDGSDVFFSFIA